MAALLLKDAFTIPDIVTASDFVLQLHEGVQDSARTVRDYVITDALAHAFGEALGYVGRALVGRSDQGVFVHGSFGSGKSHFMAVLDLLLRGDPAARALPGLQAVVATHQEVLAGKRLLTIDYHLIGAESLESALFAGYLDRISQLHPDAKPPLLHRDEALFVDAARLRATQGDDAFFTALGSAADAGWGTYGGGWNAASYDAAIECPPGHPERVKLAGELVAAFFTSYTKAGQWVEIADGLAIIASDAKTLGYDGIVLFLDELVLWLASHVADRDFVSTEGSKVAKLVETGVGHRAIPLVSFVARQRDLKDFVGDHALGVERLAIGETFRFWEDRFNKITLQAGDLPEIAHKRLLQPRSDEARRAIGAALASVKANRVAWDTLLTDEAGSDEAAFAKVYPFSPALVDTLVALSALLQRERTALKVMLQLLVDGRDLKVSDVIPVGDLYDVMVGGANSIPLTQEMQQLFSVARRLYDNKLRPMLLTQHNLTGTEAMALPRTSAFATDDRLVKTLLIAALAPAVPALRNLTGAKLAALNHGSVKAFVPGTESAQVLAKVRAWSELGEVQVGDGSNPLVSIQLSGVDYDSVVEMVRAEDRPGDRRRLLRALVFAQLGLPLDNGLGFDTPYPVVWRGSKRTLSVIFGNLRDETNLPTDALRADGQQWKIVIDYPFDDSDHSPREDHNRISELRANNFETRTVAWIPSFLTAARQDDLGRLVLLDYLLSGTAERFDANAGHLPADQRPLARSMLENQRRSLTERLNTVIRQAYGVAKHEPHDIDPARSVEPFAVLWEVQLQPPVGATLKDAFSNLAGQLLDAQYPDHPRFQPGDIEVKRAEVNAVLTHVTDAISRGGRVDPVAGPDRARLRRVANTLGIGECYENHYVFDAEKFAWRTRLVRWAAEAHLGADIPVSRIRQWLAPYGMARDVENLVIAAWALLDDKQWSKAGAPVKVTGVEQITDDLVLREPQLPDQVVWDAARGRAAALFGVTVAPLRSAATLTQLADAVRTRVREQANGAGDLVSQLQAHRVVLDLGEDAPRLVTASLGRDLTARLGHEQDDLVLVAILAEAAIPTEPQPLARSLATAGQVAAALRAATWNILEAVGRIPDAARIATVLGPLREAAAAEELHQPLEPALTTAVSRGATLLAGESVPTPPSPPAPDQPEQKLVATVNDVTLVGVETLSATLDRLRDEISRALPEHRDQQLHLSWWFE